MARGRALAVALAVAGALGGCWSGEAPAGGGPAVTAHSDSAGGVVRLLSGEQVATWDPQRIANRHDAAFAGRLFQRTLTAYTPVDAAGRSRLVGDLATDTGTPSADLRTWTFTLRDGPAWEDGSPVTCQDVRFGIARTFATDRVTGGVTDAVALLDIPRHPDGTSTFAGPYATGDAAKAGAAAFDDAVACERSTLTFRLAVPVPDFAAVVSQVAFGPVKSGHEPGSDPFTVFSNGPYRLAGPWEPGTGGRFERNPGWRAESDPVRKAYPDEIDYAVGVSAQAIARDVLGDTEAGRNAVAVTPLPLELRQQVQTIPGLARRSIGAGTGMVEHLLPNVKSPVMSHPQARRALALATDRLAYVAALGGSATAVPVRSLIPGGLTAAHTQDPVGAPLSGDPLAARAQLARAGLGERVELRVAYRSGDAADRAMAALARGWDAAGFHTVLTGLDDYFTQSAAPDAAAKYDVFWNVWAPTWDSAATILPPIFDARVNLTAAGTGRDLGSWSSPEVARAAAAAAEQGDRAAREQGWASLDQWLLGEVAYVGLAQRRSVHVAGSAIRNLSAMAPTGGDVDLAVLAVAR